MFNGGSEPDSFTHTQNILEVCITHCSIPKRTLLTVQGIISYYTPRFSHHADKFCANQNMFRAREFFHNTFMWLRSTEKVNLTITNFTINN